MHGTLDFSEKEQIVKLISDNNVRILNLCHIPEEGKLKVLSFPVSNSERVREILCCGERIDGSSLFSSIEPGKSDIYIMPTTRGFIDPFAALPTMNVLCEYLDESGKPIESAPQSVLARADKRVLSSTGISLRAMAELEFYIISKQQTADLFTGSPDKNYHESPPFAKFQDLRNEMLATLDIIGIDAKYAHAEVGRIFAKSNAFAEQHEIELRPQNLMMMAEMVAVAKWIIRNVCARHGVLVSFVPKIDVDHAGSGMHIHMCGTKNGENIVVNPDRSPSVECLEMIAGILKLAPSLSAFGNPTPVSYLRFIARKESPMHICWGSRDRLALVRIPLWWSFRKSREKKSDCKETFEYRAPDAFANTYLLLAALAVAVGYGLRNPKEARRIAEDLHVEASGAEKFETLPCSCSEAAEGLEKDRQYYEANGIFPKKIVDSTVKKLKAYQDRKLLRELSAKPAKMESMIAEYLHYG
jgi:glutamine synthetase